MDVLGGRALARQHGVTTRAAYLDLVNAIGSSNNGVFGAKMMWNNVPWVLQNFREMEVFADRTRAEVFRAVFPDLHVIHLTRRDRIRQADSWARAAQDGVWIVSDNEPAEPFGEPAYSRELIGGMVQLIEEGERGWRAFFDELRVTPYEVVYEDLVDQEGYRDVIQGTLESLGLDKKITIPPPRTRRPSDELNDAWVDRFMKERTG
jgi:LPS sulfotransferase NodH